MLIVAGTAGWRIYDHFQLSAAEAAGARYQAALDLAKADKNSEAAAAFNAVANHAPKGYATLARLAAADAQSAKDPKGAAAAYEQIAADPAIDPAYQDVARLRGAYLNVDLETPEQFAQHYAAYAGPDLPYRNAFRELIALADTRGRRFHRRGALVRAGRSRSRLARSLARPRRRFSDHRPGGRCAGEIAMFKIAIVGRPNVGKSTLFNRLVGKKLALVDDLPGVTRDRRAGTAHLGDLTFTIIDTAGLETGAPATLAGRMRAQTEAAIAEADAIFFMIDARAGIMPDDRAFASLLRRADKPLILIANKAEGRAGTAGAQEAFDLGFGDPVGLSAEHGDGLSDLYSALREALPEATELGEEEAEETAVTLALGDEEDGSELDPTKPLRVAIIGRPNAGKSTLLNRILGEERLLTGPEAGITRDSIGVDLEWRDRKLKMFDTAGLRKRARVDEKLEKLAGADALRAAKFAEVVVLLIDAAAPLEKQDLTLADLIAREGRALVIGVSKWDLVQRSRRAAEGTA